MPAQLQKPEVIYQGGNTSGPRMYREGDTSVVASRFRVGDIVRLDANGRVIGFLDNTAADATSGATSNAALGIVLAPSRNRATATSDLFDVPVLCFDDNFLFYLPLWHSTAANAAVLNPSTLAQQVTPGEVRRIRCRAGIYCIDLVTAATTTTAADACVQIVDIPPAQLTETFAPVLCKWVPAKRAIA